MLRCTLGELHAKPGAREELPLWVALAEHDGPWWGIRADYHAAMICRSLSAEPGELSDYLPDWTIAEKQEIQLIPFADAARIICKR